MMGLTCSVLRTAFLRAAVVLGVALAEAATPVLAAAQIQGKPDAVRIEANDTSIEEILTALGGAFDLRYRSSTALSKQITGTYEGSLQRVVARVLEGYNFVLKTAEGRIEVTVLGSRSAAPTLASSSSTPAPSKPAPLAPPAAAAAPSKFPQPVVPSVQNVAPPTAPARSKPADDAKPQSVMAMVDSAARAQLPGSNAAAPAVSPGHGGMPAPAELAALARRAGRELETIRAALDRLPK